MLRNRTENKTNINDLLITPQTRNRNKKSSILPPSSKTPYENVANSYESIELNRPIPRVQTSNAMFDPNNASPASDFMDLLKLRMSVYYDNEMDIFRRK